MQRFLVFSMMEIPYILEKHLLIMVQGHSTCIRFELTHVTETDITGTCKTFLLAMSSLASKSMQVLHIEFFFLLFSLKWKRQPNFPLTQWLPKITRKCVFIFYFFV